MSFRVELCCFLALGLFASLPDTLAAQTPSRVELGAIDASVVRIFALGEVGVDHVQAGSRALVVAEPRGGHGTGFVVSDDGFILTAAHVVRDAYIVAVRVPGDERVYPARVAYTDAEHDVAVLVTEARAPAIAFRADGALRVRSTVFALGYPIDPRRRDAQSSRGIVAGLLDDGSLQLDISVNPGNSGGPLLDEQDHVVGMVVARGNVEDGVTNIGVAVPNDWLAAALAAASNLLATNAVPALSTDAQASVNLLDELVHHGSLGELRTADHRALDVDRAIGERVATLLEGVSDVRIRLVAAAFLWNAALGLTWREYGVSDLLTSSPERVRPVVLALLQAVSRICADIHASDPTFRDRSAFLRFILDYATQRIDALGRGEQPLRDEPGRRLVRPPPKHRGFVLIGPSVRFNPSTGRRGYGFHLLGGGLVKLHGNTEPRTRQLALVLGQAFSFTRVADVNRVGNDAFHFNIAVAELGLAYRFGTPSRQAIFGVTWAPGLYLAVLDVYGYVDSQFNELDFEALGLHVFVHARFRRLIVGTGFRMLSGPTIWLEPLSIGITL